METRVIRWNNLIKRVGPGKLLNIFPLVIATPTLFYRGNERSCSSKKTHGRPRPKRSVAVALQKAIPRGCATEKKASRCDESRLYKLVSFFFLVCG